MKISQTADRVSPSLTRKLFNMALEIGDDVINLTLGDPDVAPPTEIKEAACEAIMEGKTRYSANAGHIALRETYAAFFSNNHSKPVNPQKNIIATVGGMEALFLCLSAIIDRDDEVIVLAPYYVNYVQMINMLGGKARIINRLGLSDEQTKEEILKNTSAKTVAIMVNSPCNPTGEILGEELLKSIADIAAKKDMYVISDEVYDSLVYDGKKCASIYDFEGMEDRTIVIDSCSKRFAMTGWRIGFAVAPEAVIAAMTKMQENVCACAPVVSQYAAIKAYSGGFDSSYIREIYNNRRDIVYNAIKQIPLLDCIKPQATFYCFVDITKTGLAAEDFCYKLLKEAHVAVVPGNAYGDEYSNYIRIAFTLKEEVLTAAMERINKFCQGLIK